MQPLFALFVRTLREDMRSKSTYLIRAGLVCVILFFLWSTHMTHQYMGASGRTFFQFVLWIDLVIVSVAGLGLFSSVITEEKEDGTLGLLRMTNLNGLAILLGKSTGKLLTVLLLLIAQIPFALVAVTMGGISTTQIFAGYAYLLAITFLAANFGLLASVWFQRGVLATCVAFGALGLFALGPYFALKAFTWAMTHWPAFDLTVSTDLLNHWWTATPSPYLSTVLRTGFRGPIWGEAIAICLGLGTLCFGLAWRLFDASADRTLAMGEGLSTKSSRLNHSRRIPALGLAAVRAREFSAAGGWRSIWIYGLVSVGLLTAIYLGVGTIPNGPVAPFRLYAGIYILVLSGIAYLEFALSIEAGNIFGAERRQKTLGALCGLPLSVGQLIRAKIVGRLATMWPAAIPLAIGLAMLLWLAGTEYGRRPSNASSFIYGTFFSCTAALTLLELPVLIAWMSLQFRRIPAAGGFALWFIGNIVLSSLCGVIFRDESSLVVYALVTGLCLLGTVLYIPKRLESLASEE